MVDERERIALAKSGDVLAWEALVEEHQQPVFRLAYLMLGDADDAADVAQETFIRAYRALPRVDAERPLRPWLLSIASNLSRNWRRSAGRYFFALQRLLWSMPQAAAPVQQAEQRLEADAVRQAVRQLSRPDQEIIYLRYYLDCSEAEMAEVLGVAAGTVKSRLHRALARLKKIFPQPEEEEQPDVV